VVSLLEVLFSGDGGGWRALAQHDTHDGGDGMAAAHLGLRQALSSLRDADSGGTAH
jgi:hypothetical protein